MQHARDEITGGRVYQVLPDRDYRTIPRHATGCKLHINSAYPKGTVVRSTRYAVTAFKHDNACYLPALMNTMSRTARDILFKPSGVPNLDVPIFGSTREEEVVWRDSYTSNSSSVFDKVRDECTLGSSMGTLPTLAAA